MKIADSKIAINPHARCAVVFLATLKIVASKRLTPIAGRTRTKAHRFPKSDASRNGIVNQGGVIEWLSKVTSVDHNYHPADAHLEHFRIGVQ